MNLSRPFLLAGAFAFALLCSVPAARAADPKEVTISASDQMKYDTTNIDAEPDQTVSITLTNDGSMPKIAMAHNLVVLRQGTDVNAFIAAAAKAAANGYIPAEMKGQILAQTKLLGPGETDTVSFTPTKAGTYEYVCTFPAHAAAGMRGTIVVKK